ncbi:hypothetical protein TrispH2_008480 [Trichoplax sp. H2]|nr:hypothetical protein TrispH2_008480 [Trichoplax sp. H2]|eukprot:RDD40330.1 hypothetical protein TrispH2_008480 [Trichoplax sp. H2]
MTMNRDTNYMKTILMINLLVFSTVEGKTVTQTVSEFSCPTNCRCYKRQIFCKTIADVSLKSIGNDVQTLAIRQEILCTNEKVIALLKQAAKVSTKLAIECRDSKTSVGKMLILHVNKYEHRNMNSQDFAQINSRIKRSLHDKSDSRPNAKPLPKADRNYSSNKAQHSSPKTLGDNSNSSYSSNILFIIIFSIFSVLLIGILTYCRWKIKRDCVDSGQEANPSLTRSNVNTCTFRRQDHVPPPSYEATRNLSTGAAVDCEQIDELAIEAEPPGYSTSVTGRANSPLGGIESQQQSIDRACMIRENSAHHIIVNRVQECEILPDYDSLN